MSTVKYDPEFSEVLSRVLTQSGFAASPAEEQFEIKVGEFTLAPLLKQEQKQADGIYSMQVGIKLAHPFLNGPVIETLFAFGHSRTDALWQASMVLKEGVFEAIDNGLKGYYFPELDFKSFDLLSPDHFHVLPGPLQGNMQPEDWGDDLLQENDFFLLLRSVLQERFREGDFHWVKVHLARTEKGEVFSDVRIDNERDMEASLILESIAELWKDSSRHQMIKQFLFFRKCQGEH